MMIDKIIFDYTVRINGINKKRRFSRSPFCHRRLCAARQHFRINICWFRVCGISFRLKFKTFTPSKQNGPYKANRS